jgi:alpha-mannosidase
MPQSTNLFSWPMNNYWTTNFNAEQRGGHSWTYYLTSSSDASNGFATRFGWGCRIPYLTRIIPGDGNGDNKWEGSFISGWPSNVILIFAEPSADGNSVLVHLREMEGKQSELKLMNGINSKPLTINEVDVTGKPITNGSRSIGALESKFFRIELK